MRAYIWFCLVAFTIAEWILDINWVIVNDYLAAGKAVRYGKPTPQKHSVTVENSVFNVRFGRILVPPRLQDPFDITRLSDATIEVTHGIPDYPFGVQVMHSDLERFTARFAIVEHSDDQQSAKVLVLSDTWIKLANVENPALYLVATNVYYPRGRYEFVLYINGQEAKRFAFSVKEYCDTHLKTVVIQRRKCDLFGFAIDEDFS